MKSEWKVQTNPIGDNNVIYQVFRWKNINEVKHSGNMEHCGEPFADREMAQEYADFMNQPGLSK